MRRLPSILLGVPLFILAWLMIVRIVRHFYKFPMPEFMAPFIDNPLRRRVQPPAEMALRHGIEPGMRVLEVGPGSGRYTVATARRVGPTGRVVAIDIEPKMIERVIQRAQAEGVNNIEARLADVYALPFDDASFDAAYMITVIGEIPDPVQAMREIRRVLVPGGTLAFSEVLIDPDYPLATTTARHATAAGLHVKYKSGNWLAYTLVLERAEP